MLSTLGADRTVLAVALVLTAAGAAVTAVWRVNLLLYQTAVTLGVVTGGLVLYWNGARGGPDVVAVRETNYYTITVTRVYHEQVGEIDGNPVKGRHERLPEPHPRPPAPLAA